MSDSTRPAWLSELAWDAMLKRFSDYGITRVEEITGIEYHNSENVAWNCKPESQHVFLRVVSDELGVADIGLSRSGHWFGDFFHHNFRDLAERCAAELVRQNRKDSESIEASQFVSRDEQLQIHKVAVECYRKKASELEQFIRDNFGDEAI